VHRDIKLDNIVFSSKDKMAKITDFTVAREVNNEDFMFDSEGTPAYTGKSFPINNS
jgi:serine/threonine protein kinase